MWVQLAFWYWLVVNGIRVPELVPAENAVV
jgi:hypothetical protein